MTGHDDHKRVMGDRLRDRMHGAGRSEPAGDFAVSAGFAARDRLRELVDALVERVDAGCIERTSEKSLASPRSSAAMPSIAISTFTGGPRPAGVGVERPQPLAGFDLARLGELNASDPAIAPCDAASADCR